MVMKKAREHENGEIPVFRVEHRLRTGRGNYKWILNWGKVIERDREGKPIRAMGIHLDIDDRRKMEEEIIRSEKMKSIGILAGGIAHDFNNLLAVMLGNVSLIRVGGVRGERLHHLIGEVEKACIKSRDLTRELMTFTRNVEVVAGDVPVGEIIRESAEFTLHGSNIRCEIDIVTGTRAVRGDRSQIKRALHNIFLNARQAMPEGGVIRVRCSGVNLKGSDNIPLVDGEYIEIEISDNGVGIPSEIQDRIFDPFFSTREDGRGIGLAACDSIIRKHRGHILFESEPGEGSTFYIYLPASDELPGREDTPDGEVLKGSGKVMVVDDEESIRKMAEEMLEALGYTADTASGGEEALRLYRKGMEEDNPYHVVIIDLTIPGEKGGREILRDLIDLDGGVRAIVSSGYSEGDVIANYREYGFAGRLAKPYRMRGISQVLKEVIQSGD
jgi:signal transduction histidine kinase/ActR/RegA family two-component response regulator